MGSNRQGLPHISAVSGHSPIRRQAETVISLYKKEIPGTSYLAFYDSIHPCAHAPVYS